MPWEYRNITGSEHHFIKQIQNPIPDFEAFHFTAAILAEIEVTHMIHKGQLGQTGALPFKYLYALAI